MARTVKTIFEDVLGTQRARVLWTANYYPALSITPQSFDIGALLPAMLYMARWGHRRGKGKFIETFGRGLDGKRLAPTISDVSSRLIQTEDACILGFDDPVGHAMLGDLLLTWSLENKNHAEGHEVQIQRIFPTHYLSSWIDLPDKASSLRGVPELITCILADQRKGELIGHGTSSSHYEVGVAHQENALLDKFSSYMSVRGPYTSDLASDEFLEDKATEVGIDELLVVRLAYACGSAPLKAKGKDESEGIQNRHPIAKRASKTLRDDLTVFIEIYSESIPRQAFLMMLEAGMGLGMTNLILSTFKLLMDWAQYGKIQEATHQKPWPLFVDASHGQDGALRELSESVMTETVRRYERFPVLMATMRILDDAVRSDRKLRDELPETYPDPTELLNLLGSVYLEQHPRSDSIFDKLDENCLRLANELEAENESEDLIAALRRGSESPALRLAEAICELMGDKLQRLKYKDALDSASMTDRPNGLSIKRRVLRTMNGIKRMQDLKAIVLTPPLLDFLVHRHLRNSDQENARQSLSYQDFLKVLREGYGLYVDREPPGHKIPQELLIRNKAWLERRLRDLGLLIGVNDAESMKQLKPRYEGKNIDVA